LIVAIRAVAHWLNALVEVEHDADKDNKCTLVERRGCYFWSHW
jgi:hypothetical protein